MLVREHDLAVDDGQDLLDRVLRPVVVLADQVCQIFARDACDAEDTVAPHLAVARLVDAARLREEEVDVGTAET
eukprot:402701-Prymnesium_polylepis.1